MLARTKIRKKIDPFRLSSTGSAAKDFCLFAGSERPRVIDLKIVRQMERQSLTRFRNQSEQSMSRLRSLSLQSKIGLSLNGTENGFSIAESRFRLVKRNAPKIRKYVGPHLP